jgi:tetratricopeptide (TPR) repeat protein
MTVRSACIAGVLLLLFGCGELPRVIVVQKPERPPEKEDPFRGVPETYRAKAIEHEKAGDLQQAILAWKIVHGLKPDDAESSRKIQDLTMQAQALAESHFRKGVEFAGRNAQAARREFLMALVYKADYREALEYLRQKATDPDVVVYEVVQGDTPAAIAQKLYRDPGKDVVVAYFSDLGSGDQLRPGTVLRLPVIDAEPKADAKTEPRMQPKAAPKPKPAAPAASYDKAGAETHYRKGVQYYLAENLQGAVKEWEEALRLDPEHPSARRDIEKARRLLETLQSK